MKRILLLLIVAVIGTAAATARHFYYTYEGKTMTYTVLDEAAKTVSVNGFGLSGDIIIPEKACEYGLDEYSVVSIEDRAFFTCTDLTSVSIPESVTYVGVDVFNSKALTKAEFASIESLCKINFANCASNPLYYTHHLYIKGEEIKDLVIPETVTSIGAYAFYGCSSITSVTIPRSVSVIGDSAFGGCNKIKLVSVKSIYPPAVSVIGDATLYAKAILDIPAGSLQNYLDSEWRNFDNIRENGLMAKTYSDGVLQYRLLPDTVNREAILVRGDYSDVEEVSIPERITDMSDPNNPVRYIISTISENAFSGCTKLRSVNFHSRSKITTIETGAFCGCSSLTSVTIPESVVSIGSSAFDSCSGLTSVTIGNSVIEIGSRAFYKCRSLTSVVIPCSVSKIGTSAFNSCSSLTSLTIGNSVTEIGSNAFYKCSGLTSVAIPSSVSYIGSYAFDSCSDLTSVTIPNSIKSIPQGAFYGCSGLTSITIPNSVTAIGSSAFAECSGLSSIIIPDSVISIGSSCFAKCSSLSSVVIGSSVTSIGKGAFSECDGLTKAEYASIEALCGITFASSDANPLSFTKHLYVNGEEITDLVIPSSVRWICPYAFYNCIGLTSVTIPESVTWVGDEAFFSRIYNGGIDTLTILTDGLDSWDELRYLDFKTVIIGDKVAEIPAKAFENCHDMTQVMFGNSVTTIGMGAFMNCESLTSIVIPNSVKSIGSSAFYNCSGLTSVIIPKSITSIPDYAFYHCSGLTSVIVPESVTSIGVFAFSRCSSLTEFTIGNSVTSIGNYAFSDCTAITDLTIGNSVPLVSSNVFDWCSAIKNLTVTDGPGTLLFQPRNSWLDNVTKLHMGRNMAYTNGFELKFPAVNDLTVGNEVTEIGASMFSNCTGLKNLTLGNSLQKIGSSAFSGCSLIEVVVPPSVETIGASAFAGNNKLATIIMGYRIKSIGEKAFDGCEAQNIYITALTPPTAPNNTFSRYTGKLWVANAKAIEDYYDAYTCWDRFDSYAMIEPESIVIDGDKYIDALPGDVINLKATVSPDNVTLPYIFWRSTNPEVATVDNNGVVTINGSKSEFNTFSYGEGVGSGCRIIAESLYATLPVVEVVINDDEVMDIDEVFVRQNDNQEYIDYAEPYDVYNINGELIGHSLENLQSGFYIVRQGATTVKIIK